MFNPTTYGPSGLLNPDLTVTNRKSFLVREHESVAIPLPKPPWRRRSPQKVELCVTVSTDPHRCTERDVESGIQPPGELRDAHVDRFMWLGLFVKAGTVFNLCALH